jgi:transposase InsO family protein
MQRQAVGSDALGSCGFGATRLRASEATSGDLSVSAAKGRRSAFAGAVARAGCDPATVGYRRLKILLKREGFAVNHKRVYRLYVEEKLGLRRKRGRRRMPTAARVPLQLPVRPDQVWTMDFTQGAFATGRRFQRLNLMDGFTRYALRIEVDTSLPGLRVVRALEELKGQARKPEAIRIITTRNPTLRLTLQAKSFST